MQTLQIIEEFLQKSFFEKFPAPAAGTTAENIWWPPDKKYFLQCSVEMAVFY